MTVFDNIKRQFWRRPNKTRCPAISFTFLLPRSYSVAYKMSISEKGEVTRAHTQTQIRKLTGDDREWWWCVKNAGVAAVTEAWILLNEGGVLGYASWITLIESRNLWTQPKAPRLGGSVYFSTFNTGKSLFSFHHIAFFWCFELSFIV